MTITSYRDLDAWRLGMDLAEAVYKITKQFPAEERFGLSAQLRRSAVGIPSNVAEGHQLGPRSYRRFVTIALGCAAECETQLELAHRTELVDRKTLKPVMQLASRVAQVLHGLRRSLPRREKNAKEKNERE